MPWCIINSAVTSELDLQTNDVMVILLQNPKSEENYSVYSCGDIELVGFQAVGPN